MEYNQIKDLLLSFKIVGWTSHPEIEYAEIPVFKPDVEINPEGLSESEIIRITNIMKRDSDVKNHFINLILKTYNRNDIKIMSKQTKEKPKEVRQRINELVAQYIENANHLGWAYSDEEMKNTVWGIDNGVLPQVIAI